MARTFEAVTTFSADGYRLYGRRMIESFAKHWAAAVALRVYSENSLPRGDARDFPQWLRDFRKRHEKSTAAAGRGANARTRGQYNYRLDALRFAYKTAAVIDAAERTDADVLIWVDADTVTHSPVSLEFLRELAPGPQQAISWLWRDKNYPECGFYMLNMGHPDTHAVLHNWKGLYETDRLFHLPEWHDSYVLAEVVRTLRAPWKSISGVGSSTGHPFINGPLGAVMDHMKGNRKIQGRSNQQDLRVVREEPYWRQP